jgi:hypothetical protein
VIAIALLFNLSDASAEDKLRPDGVQNPQGKVFPSARRRWNFAKYYGGSRIAPAARPVVPSPAIGGENDVFHGTGDGSGGGWIRP